MKQIKLLCTAILLFTAYTFTSCSDNEPVDPAIIIPIPNPNNPDPNNPEPETGIFKADINGTTFTATTTIVYITGGSIQISALRAQGDSFGILLDGTTTGTYSARDNIIAYTPAGEEFGYWGINPTDDTQETGAIIVTEIDTVNKTISGTFSYTGYWSDADVTTIPPKQFTNGSFTNLPYVTNSPTSDTFVAKVNGIDYNQNDLLAVTADLNGVEFISVGTTNAAGDGMTVSVRSNLTAGSYQITGNLATDVVQINYSTPEGEAFATAGQVIITELTATRVKGTFSAIVTIAGETFQITAGNFDVEY